MPKRKTTPTNIANADALARLLEDFDFRVESDDFILYEVGRLIEEDRASFEDEEFRRIIDMGIHCHIEDQPAIRAQLASRLRRASDAGALRTTHTLEDETLPLRNLSLIVRTYTAYIFRRLHEIAGEPADRESAARSWLESWQQNGLPLDSLSEKILSAGRDAVGPLADLLFEFPEDRKVGEAVLDLLGHIQCPSSARVLANAILEPILPEDLELKAYNYTRILWPLVRHYLLFALSDHTHEDLSFRWFQLLVESDELTAADMIIDEVLTHGEDPAYAEDLSAIIELLRLSRDPDVEEKVLAVINDPGTAAEAARRLQTFISNFRPAPQPSGNPWQRARRLSETNEEYRDAARLFESGNRGAALQALEQILKNEPDYPFAMMLKGVITSDR